jgi:hypothetical protein
MSYSFDFNASYIMIHIQYKQQNKMTYRFSSLVLVPILSSYITMSMMVPNIFAIATSVMNSPKHVKINVSHDTIESWKKASTEHVYNMFTLPEEEPTSSTSGTRNLKKTKRLSDECRQDERAQMNLLEFLQVSNDTMHFDIGKDAMYYDRDYCKERGLSTVYCDFSNAPWVDELRDDCMSLSDQQMVFATLRINDFDDGKMVIMDNGAICLPVSCDPVEYANFLSNVVTVKVKKDKDKRTKKQKASA